MDNQGRRSLDVIEDCSGCGVCCLHMGYPAFMLPRAGATADQIETDTQFQQLRESGWTRDELLRGHEGEVHWHRLPDQLKQEWQAYVAAYRPTGDLDGPCFWFDMETRRCKNHQYRPQVCRDFKAGSRACRQWRKEYSV